MTLNEACTERSIATLLEFPVVRLPQYLEYLGAIHAHMPSDAKGCDDLELAIKEIQKVPDQIAKSLRSQKNRKQVVRVQEEHFRGAVALVDPTRSWIREGEVTVTYNKSKGDSNKQLNAFLFNDMLLFGTLGSTFSSPSVKYIVQVCGMLVENIPDGHDVKFAWRVRSQLDDRAFTVSAPTYQAKVAWMRALAGQIAREDTTKQTKVLHPEEFEKRIIKKKNDESRLLPRPKAVIPVVPDLPPSLQKQDSAAGGGGMSSPRAGGAGMGPGGSSSPSSAIDGPEALLYGAPQKPQKPMTLRRPVPPAPGAPGAPGGAAAAAGGATAAPPAVPRPPPRPPGHPHPPPAAPGGPAAGTAAATSSSSTSSGAHDEAPPPVPAFDLPSVRTELGYTLLCAWVSECFQLVFFSPTYAHVCLRVSTCKLALCFVWLLWLGLAGGASPGSRLSFRRRRTRAHWGKPFFPPFLFPFFSLSLLRVNDNDELPKMKTRLNNPVIIVVSATIL